MYLILILLSIFCKTCFRETLVERIHALPQEERSYIDYFFKTLVYEEGFGYSLFFDKPVCFSGYVAYNPAPFFVEAYQNPYYKKGWLAWQKYESLFPHSNFLFIEEDLVTPDLEKFEREKKIKISIKALYVINKREFINCLEQNKELFTRLLGDPFSPQNILKRIEESQCFTKAINNHEGVLGILLGFGVESSLQFAKRDIDSQNPLVTKTLEYSLETAENPKMHLCPFQSIVFVGNPNSEEVIEILRKNDIQRRKLCRIYHDKNFLEVTLQKLYES